jgi:quercetin dioxygenase-like cupin family protein
MVDMNRSSLRGYAKVITDLPEADIQSEGIRGWILQGENHQLLFLQLESNARIPEHNHEYTEWAMVIEGEMELTVEGKISKHKRGDEVLIPAHAKHKARSLTGSRLVSLFSERARYRTKPHI